MVNKTSVLLACVNDRQIRGPLETGKLDFPPLAKCDTGNFMMDLRALSKIAAIARAFKRVHLTSESPREKTDRPL